jgi:hypothetical protein
MAPIRVLSTHRYTNMAREQLVCWCCRRPGQSRDPGPSAPGNGKDVPCECFCGYLLLNRLQDKYQTRPACRFRAVNPNCCAAFMHMKRYLM